MKFGYARVSTQGQAREGYSLGAQVERLEQAGCERVFQEAYSGKNRERPELKEMLSQLREGDSVVVVKLDRLGRSLSDLLELLKEIEGKKANLVSLSDSIDTSTPTGKLLFSVMGAIAEFEREMILERTAVGQMEARKQGKLGGRPKEFHPELKAKAEELRDRGMKVDEVCKVLGISPASYYRIRSENNN